MEKTISKNIVPKLPIEEILNDYRICCLSRALSLSIRKEVLTGKAKFGVSDDGKELLQIAMAKAFKKGDFRADYYRGQTFLLALELCKPEDFYAQLYADAAHDPFSGGRQMNNHHATPLVDENGNWLPHKELYNLSSDISTTAGQMARGIGLAFASKVYRNAKHLGNTPFSNQGNEVCFCIIGDASTSEGAFWESINAAGVTQIPLAVTIMDDGYGISVAKKYQTTKESISKVLEGFREENSGDGIDIHHVMGWDYLALCAAYEHGIEKVRKKHVPAVFHIDEMTQPQGHSTSGSHERYKSKERLQWEAEFDCNRKFKEWILENGYSTPEVLEKIEQQVQKEIKKARDIAWEKHYSPVVRVARKLDKLYTRIVEKVNNKEQITQIHKNLNRLINPVRSELFKNVRQMMFALRKESGPEVDELQNFIDETWATMHQRYHTHLYCEGEKSALKVPVIPPQYADNSPTKNGFEILNDFFDKSLEKHPNLYIFGEDVGKIGDVNQGLAGMQAKHSEHRVFDTGIREWTIVGQALGMAMRGLRPIAEIQYLDYLIYGYSPLSDDVATLRYRSNNIQIAPAIIRTRGHRLEGIWHSGSPMSMLLGGLRGIYILVPRNMVQAAGMYNTLLQANDPAILIECLNGYRRKEQLPDNMGTYTIPLGVPEILQEGTDITLVTYGACVRIAQEGIKMLEKEGISVELIDVQTLLPFDLEGCIINSLKKTNRIVFLDEDVPGGATAYMMQEVLEKQKGYFHLDSPPVTITATDHRPPYGTNGDYFSKPNTEDVYEVIFKIIQEAEPERF